MPPVMNRNEVQAPLASPQSKASYTGAVSPLRPADAREKKAVNVPVGSIAAIESQLGF
ncbi:MULTISPECIES: hypothetical protein [Ancylobacter]|uniref:Uncharacterized protein n=2 Tax=Ancylobacter polymorphus TaxID=223390 RepID=A0A9E6ZQ34_9HYPH|nr:hypothetical protein [Ancylobacter polymorphus]UOK69644.1 hypothetical protein K9D25_12860 [Ancylobacter polymorphus]